MGNFSLNPPYLLCDILGLYLLNWVSWLHLTTQAKRRIMHYTNLKGTLTLTEET